MLLWILFTIALCGVSGIVGRSVDKTEFESNLNYLSGTVNNVVVGFVKIITFGRKATPELQAVWAKVWWAGFSLLVSVVLLFGGLLMNAFWLTVASAFPLLIVCFLGFMVAKQASEIGNSGPSDTQHGFFNAFAAVFGVPGVYLASIILLHYGLKDLAPWLLLPVFFLGFLVFACGFFILYRMTGHTGYGGLTVILTTGAVAAVMGLVNLTIPWYIQNLKSEAELASQAQKNQADANRAALSKQIVRVSSGVGKFKSTGLSDTYQDWKRYFIGVVSDNDSGPVRMNFVADGNLEKGDYRRFDGLTYQDAVSGELLIRLVKPNANGEIVGIGESQSFFAVQGKKVQLTNPTVTPVTTDGKTDLPEADVSIPMSAFTNGQWSEYGVGYDGSSVSSPKTIWMRSVGEVSFPFELKEVNGKNISFSATLSSELMPDAQRQANGDPNFSSDVTLEVNGQPAGTQNVITDNGIGKKYTWTVPATVMRTETGNVLTFKVAKEATHKNGLTFYSSILGTFSD